MSDTPALDVSWLRRQAKLCLNTARFCDSRANSLWSWITFRRRWWRREAAFWRSQQEKWNDLADELEEKARAQH